MLQPQQRQAQQQQHNNSDNPFIYRRTDGGNYSN